MPVAAAPAVPKYLGSNFDAASPALRFNMLFPAGEKGYEAWSGLGAISEEIRRCQDSLIARQAAVSGCFQDSDKKLTLTAKNSAPFVTGLGIEHPSENGFAFLNPYGLPYLPGSGVKGVLRRAAKELASDEWFDSKSWNEDSLYCDGKRTMIDVLFGNDPGDGGSDHAKGALSFWDVIPQVKNNRLCVEVMTPHQTHYFQQSESPHDSGKPNPILFLTVPPGSQFTFFVTCDRERLARQAQDLAAEGRWKTLLTAAFEHAFQWLGFGAKTSVGYGAMLRDYDSERKAEEAEQERAVRREEEKILAELPKVEREIREALENRSNKGEPETTTIFTMVRGDKWEGEDKIEAAKWLQSKLQEEVNSKPKPKGEKLKRLKSKQKEVEALLKGE